MSNKRATVVGLCILLGLGAALGAAASAVVPGAYIVVGSCLPILVGLALACRRGPIRWVDATDTEDNGFERFEREGDVGSDMVLAKVRAQRISMSVGNVEIVAPRPGDSLLGPLQGWNTQVKIDGKVFPCRWIKAHAHVRGAWEMEIGFFPNRVGMEPEEEKEWSPEANGSPALCRS